MAIAKTNSQSNPILTTFAPLVADLLAVVFYIVTAGWMVARFGRNALDFSALNDAGLLLLFHILFLIGIWMLTKLRGESKYPALQNRFLQGFFTIVYSVALVFGIADLTGYLDTLFTVSFGDMGNSYYFLITPAVYLFLGLLYLFILRQPTEQTGNPEQTSLPLLLLLNGMLIATTAFLHAFLPIHFEAMPPVALGILTYLILGTLFIFPRLLFAAKRRSLLSLISFDLLITILAFLSAVSFPL